MVNIYKRPMIILVPYPAQGHVTPMLNLATALHNQGFQPIVAVPDFIYHRISSQTHDNYVVFKSIKSGLEEGNMDFFAIERAMENHMPEEFDCTLKELELEVRVDCVVVDLLASWAIAVAERHGIKVSGFWPAMLNTYRVLSAIPKLIQRGLISHSGTPLCEQANNNLYDQEEGETESNLLIPPKGKHSTKHLPWLVGNSTSQKSRFKFWLRTIDRTSTLPSLLVNSFPKEEEEEDDSHSSSKTGPQIFQIGPLLVNSQPNIRSKSNGECMKWLNKHPPSSVVYISFGTWVGPIGLEKIGELALGLELTNRPFIWALKDEPAWRNGLPAGFADRVKGRGKIVSWVAQEAVLGHEAVGCYVTHCGWNSMMEGMKHGKRLVCYPVAGDQFLNSFHAAKVWGVGMEVTGFGRRDVEGCVEAVMEGEEGKVIQGRVLEMKEKVVGVEGRAMAWDCLKSFVDGIKDQ